MTQKPVRAAVQVPTRLAFLAVQFRVVGLSVSAEIVNTGKFDPTVERDASNQSDHGIADMLAFLAEILLFSMRADCLARIRGGGGGVAGSVDCKARS